MSADQLDLFAAEEASMASAARTAWREQFARVDVIGGDGTAHRGWVCPGCGEAEANEYALKVNHGYDPNTPDARYSGRVAGAQCVAQMLAVLQDRSEEHRRESAAAMRAFRRAIEERGKARSIWRFPQRCAACDGTYREGEWVTETYIGRKTYIVHEHCPEETP